MVLKEGNTIQTDLFRKPTDRNTILRGDSFHPTHLIKSLPISQFHRARRICSTDTLYSKQSTELKRRFRERGYKEAWIDSAADRFSTLSQEESLRPRSKTTKDSSPRCFTKYSPTGFEFQKIMLNHWHIIDSDPKLKPIFKTPPSLVYKRPQNLRDRLVRSHVPEKRRTFLDEIPEGNYKCGNCAQCGYTTKSQTYTHTHSGKILKVRGVITCNTTYVVYLIKCPCGLGYVGRTCRPLRTRISEHRSNIRCGDERNPVAAHFKQAGHSISSLRYIGIEKVNRPPRGGDHERVLLQRETYYIYMLNTMSPYGLNEEFDIKPFL